MSLIKHCNKYNNDLLPEKFPIYFPHLKSFSSYLGVNIFIFYIKD